MQPIMTDPAHIVDQRQLVETYERLKAALIESRGLKAPVVSSMATPESKEKKATDES